MSINSFGGTCLLALSLTFLNVYAILGIRKPNLLDPPDTVTTRNTRITANLYFEQRIDNFNPTDTRTWQQVCKHFTVSKA